MIDVIVTGQSLPALQTALDLAEVGLKVAVLGPTPGAAAEQWPELDQHGAIAEFVARIAEPIEQTDEATAGKHERGASVRSISPLAPMLRKQGEWLQQSSPEVLGVPAVPLAAENIALLGSGGAFRAYLDRITPLLTVGKTRLFGELVRKRMGAKLRDQLVDPQVFERYGVLADEVEVAIAAPGLNEALSRSGALSSAVLAYSDRNVARETRVVPASGATGFRESVIHRLENYDVQILESTLTKVVSDHEGWVLRLSDGSVMNSRALVVDLGASPIAETAVGLLVHDVMPTEARIHAAMDMDVPAWLELGTSAVAMVDGWSVAIESDAIEGQPLVTSVSPAQISSRGVTRVSSGAKSLSEISAIRQDVLSGKRLPPVAQELGIESLATAQMQTVTFTAAPYRTVADRTDAAAALAQKEQSAPTLLCVGRALHGDDQSAALAAAHGSAVRLRRRLLGLQD